MKARLMSIKFTFLQYKKIIMLFFLLFLMSILSFSIGYRLRGFATVTPIIIQKCSEPISANQASR